MPTIKAKEGQSLVDFCMMMANDTATLAEAAFLNGISITDQLDINADYLVPEPAKPVKFFLMASDADQVNDSPLTGVGGYAAFVNTKQPLPKLVVEVAEGQCLVDLCMQETGISANLFALAALNGISITEPLQIKQQVKVEDATLKKVAALFVRHKPASDFDTDGPPLTDKDEGIDFWFVYEYVVQ